MITCTQITAHDCAMTKTFTFAEGGRVESTAIAHMCEGFAKVVQLADLSGLGAVLPLLTENQAITCGVPANGDAPLTTRAGVALRPEAVARTNEAFAWPYGPALFPIDVDVEGNAFASVGVVLDALEACSPWLRHVHRVARPSSSSYVAGRGLRGVHVYCAVTRGTDIPALADRMQIEQWAAGRGWVKISRSGALLVRQLSDALVYQPSRLMFEAAPVLGDGITREVPADQAFVQRTAEKLAGRPPKYRDEATGHLDVQELPPVKEIDRRRFETAKRQAKDGRRREAKRVAIDYQRENALAAGVDPAEGERYGLLATRALGDKALPSDWAIRVAGIEQPVTVATILANLGDALGRPCADPFDTWRPDLQPKHFNKAEIVMMGDKPGIWSHKMQEFFAFSDIAAANLASPLDMAAEKFCGLVEYPEAAGPKSAPFVNIKHGLEILLRDIDCMPHKNLATGRYDLDASPSVGRLIDALSRIGCANVTPAGVERALEVLADEHPRDPWKDAVLALPQWDGVPRLDTFFTDVCKSLPSDALTLTGQVLFAGLVMRQLRPGAPVPVVPVLVGPQGYGKGQFVAGISRALNMPVPSSIAFAECRAMSMKAARSVIAELAEMSGMAKKEAEEVKQWITDDVDVYRAPYERQEDEHPRRFVLVGTANKHELNRDETGNRRFMPADVLEPIDPNWSVEVPQIVAEAKARFCTDESAYYALIRKAADAVREFNAADMRHGVGTPYGDVDDLLPPILRNLFAQSGDGRIASAAIRHALDQSRSGQRISAREVARYLTSRGWDSGRTASSRYYVAPRNFIDDEAISVLSAVKSPFERAVA